MLLADCRYLYIMSYLGIVFRKNTSLSVVKRDLQLLGIFLVDPDVTAGDFLISILNMLSVGATPLFVVITRLPQNFRSQIFRSKVEQFLIYTRSSTPFPNPQDHYVGLSTVSPEVYYRQVSVHNG